MVKSWNIIYYDNHWKAADNPFIMLAHFAGDHSKAAINKKICKEILRQIIGKQDKGISIKTKNGIGKSKIFITLVCLSWFRFIKAGHNKGDWF